MLKFKSRLTAAAVLALTCLANAPARAATPVTYVSGKGNDAGNCSSPANPCRTFQFAVNQTIAGGEVKALDPADYSPVTINKSISITGVYGVGIDTNGGGAINIFASNARINLANLVIQNVSGSGTNGIGANGFGLLLTITHCTVRGFGNGIVAVFSSFRIADTVVMNNQTGILASRASGTLDHVVASWNKNAGVSLIHGGISAVDTFADNNGTGFEAGFGGFLLARSTATENGIGVLLGVGGSAISFGDNHIRSNRTDVKGGTLTNIRTQ